MATKLCFSILAVLVSRVHLQAIEVINPGQPACSSYPALPAPCAQETPPQYSQPLILSVSPVQTCTGDVDPPIVTLPRPQPNSCPPTFTFLNPTSFNLQPPAPISFQPPSSVTLLPPSSVSLQTPQSLTLLPPSPVSPPSSVVLTSQSAPAITSPSVTLQPPSSVVLTSQSGPQSPTVTFLSSQPAQNPTVNVLPSQQVAQPPQAINILPSSQPMNVLPQTISPSSPPVTIFPSPPANILPSPPLSIQPFPSVTLLPPQPISIQPLPPVTVELPSSVCLQPPNVALSPPVVVPPIVPSSTVIQPSLPGSTTYIANTVVSNPLTNSLANILQLFLASRVGSKGNPCLRNSALNDIAPLYNAIGSIGTSNVYTPVQYPYSGVTEYYVQ